MSGRVNGAGDRLRDLQLARPGGARPAQPSITPAEVLGMIDRVIALKARVAEKNHSLGYLAPALARHPGTIILAWRALQRYQVFPAEAIEAFQTAVSASTSLTYTETNAHLAVTEEFGKEAAKALVRELDRLAQTGDPARDVEVGFAWDPPRWPLPGRGEGRLSISTGSWPKATSPT